MSAANLQAEYRELLSAYTALVGRLGMCCMTRAENEEAGRVIERGKVVASMPMAPATEHPRTEKA